MSQIEGRHPVLEALLAGRGIRKIVLASEARPAPVVERIQAEARRRGVRVEKVRRHEIERMAQTRAPQGVIAFTEGFTYAALGDVLDAVRARGEVPLLLALDGVTDPHNVGALARSAEAAGGHGLILPGRRSAPVTPVVEKAAAGALAHLPVIQVGNLSAALEEARSAGLWVVALDGRAGTTVWDLELATEPLCLALGAEGPGVSRLVRERADALASIPMSGKVGSLNVSVAGGVALFEVARRRTRANRT